MLPWVGWWVQLVVNGGLGSAFDELSLNLAACEKGGAEVAGVLVNKIKPSKMEVVKHYFGKALHDRCECVRACVRACVRPLLLS